jgi:Nucleoside 2-deoxyribosyltransferase like
MKIIKPPTKLALENSEKAVFLAGSIENGVAANWQEQAERLLKGTDWTILNPRRDDWDSSWVQSKDNPHFRGQVEWELEAQERATAILMYFDPPTKSPISLLELGLFAHTGKMIVVCPHGFWRKGNVDIVCERYGVRVAGSIEEATSLLFPATSPDQRLI